MELRFKTKVEIKQVPIPDNPPKGTTAAWADSTGRMTLTGLPTDVMHNCDAMGCGFLHVLERRPHSLTS